MIVFLILFLEILKLFFVWEYKGKLYVRKDLMDFMQFREKVSFVDCYVCFNELVYFFDYYVFWFVQGVEVVLLFEDGYLQVINNEKFQYLIFWCCSVFM